MGEIEDIFCMIREVLHEHEEFIICDRQESRIVLFVDGIIKNGI